MEKTRSSGLRCMAYGCGHTYQDGFFVHIMPGNMPTEGEKFTPHQRSWLSFIGRKRSMETKDYRQYRRITLCSGHFVEEDYKSTEVQMYKRGLRKRTPLLHTEAKPSIENAIHPFPPSWFVLSSLASPIPMADESEAEAAPSSVEAGPSTSTQAADDSSLLKRKRSGLSYIRKQVICSDYDRKMEGNLAREKANDFLDCSKGEQCSVKKVHQRVDVCKVKDKPKTISKEHIFANTFQCFQQTMVETPMQTAPKVKIEIDEFGERFCNEKHGHLFDTISCKSTNDFEHKVSTEKLSGERKCKCEYCGERFDVKSLECHLLSHTSQEMNGEHNLQTHEKGKILECEKAIFEAWPENKYEQREQNYSAQCLQSDNVRIHVEENPLKTEQLFLRLCNENECGYQHALIDQKKEILGRHREDILNNQNNTVKTTENLLYACEYCKMKFNCNINLKKHLRIHTGEKPFECEHCGRNFYYCGSLVRHLSIHTEKNKCVYCGEKVIDQNELKIHLKMHREEKPFQCEHCGEKFRIFSEFKTHGKMHSKIKHKTYLKTHGKMNPKVKQTHKCKHCGKQFSERKKLKKHLISHTAIRLFECQNCGKKFTRRIKLKKHLKKHKDMPFACKICEKEYIKERDLYQHLKIYHNIERPYECEPCGKKFKHNRRLKRHLRTHGTDLPCKCETCGKEFKIKSKLDKHLLKHNLNLPYACQFCGNKYENSTNLTRHLELKHTNELPYVNEEKGFKEAVHSLASDNLHTHVEGNQITKQ